MDSIDKALRGFRTKALVLTLALTGIALGQRIEVVHNADPLDDSDRSRVIVRGTDVANSRNQPYFVWRCDGTSSFELYAAIDRFEYLGNERLRVSYRFDQQEAQNSSWSSSTEGTAVFVRGEAEREAITRKALDANELTIAVFDYRGTRHVARFNLAGIESYFRQLECLDPSREAQWTLAVGAPRAQVLGKIREFLRDSGISFQESDSTIWTESLKIVVAEPGSAYSPQTPIEITGNDQSLYERLRSALLGDYVRLHGATFSASVPDVYQVVKQVVGDRPYTEELNVLRTEDLVVRFYEPSSERTRLTFDGTDSDLYLAIVESLREQF